MMLPLGMIIGMIMGIKNKVDISSGTFDAAAFKVKEERFIRIIEVVSRPGYMEAVDSKGSKAMPKNGAFR